MFRHVEALASFLLERGHRIHLAYSDVRGSDRLTQLVAKVSAAGGKTVNLAVSNAPGPGDVAALMKLRRLVQEAQPDVIHAHSSKAGALARALVGLGVRQPVFYTPHAYYGLSGKGGMKSRVFNAAETVLGRVGTTINTCVFGWVRTLWMSGIRNAAVLPVPVCAIAIKSRPAITCGMACA